MDFSKAFEKVQQMLSDSDGQSQIQNILNMFSNETTPSEDPDNCSSLPVLSNSASSFDPSDLEMLLKIKNIMSAMNNNKSSQQSDFLRSLKPFLKTERQAKLEQAIKFMNAAKVFKAFKEINEGSD